MKIAILGGGISGLSAAFYARKKYPNASIALIEKTGRLGGWMQTRREENLLFEKGPRTFATARCPHLLKLIEELGLQDQILHSDPSAQHRFLWHRGKLCSLSSFLPKMIGPLLREPFMKRGSGEDESIYDFAVRRLGSFMTDTLIDAMTLGIYAGDIHKLSIQSCFPFLSEWERKRGSILLGALTSVFSKKKKRKKGLFTLKEGMETLVQALAEKSGADLLLHTAVEEIRQDGFIANGRFHPADLIVSALNGQTLGRITGLWTDFETLDLGIVHCAFSGDVLPKKGFGYLVPAQEKENLLGMVWDSSVFPTQSPIGDTRVSAMMRRPSVEEALDAMKRHLKVSARPIFAASHLAKEAIPQFFVGYEQRLLRFQEALKQRYPALIAVGNYLAGASVNACVGVAQSAFN